MKPWTKEQMIELRSASEAVCAKHGYPVETFAIVLTVGDGTIPISFGNVSDLALAGLRLLEEAADQEPTDCETCTANIVAAGEAVNSFHHARGSSRAPATCH